MNRDEQKIRKLFEQLRAEDEKAAPLFAHEWQAALARTNRSRRRLAIWQMSAATAVLLMLLGTGWWMFFRQSTEFDTQVEVVGVNTVTENPSQDPSPLPYQSEPRGPVRTVSEKEKSRLPAHTKRRSPVRRSSRSFREARPQPALISYWSSPTEFLLRTPGDRILKQLPRLDESVVNVNKN